MWKPDVAVPVQAAALRSYREQPLTGCSASESKEMIILTYLFVLVWEEAQGWGYRNGTFHNSIWLGKKLPL